MGYNLNPAYLNWHFKPREKRNEDFIVKLLMKYFLPNFKNKSIAKSGNEKLDFLVDKIINI
jgi:hypothetical protein